jgi:hypothetical protein
MWKTISNESGKSGGLCARSGNKYGTEVSFNWGAYDAFANKPIAGE